MTAPRAQLEHLERGTADIIPRAELLAKLEERRPLRVKLGVDPTAPDIHLGHTVGLTKLRQFQDLGHQAILLIGDFTAMVGDPSGRSATRLQLTRAAVESAAMTYQEQAFKLLDRERTEVRWNGEWLAPMRFEDVIRLGARSTVARMLEREDFAARYRDGAPIGLHEFLYPLMQAYDSVELRQRCCGVRKVEPLERALAGLDAWITGLRPDQAVTRTDIRAVEVDQVHDGRIKLNPLVRWSRQAVLEYVEYHHVPINPLHAQGYPTVGCVPCTRSIQDGEDVRAGRWWWESPAARECGIHVGYEEKGSGI